MILLVGDFFRFSHSPQEKGIMRAFKKMKLEHEIYDPMYPTDVSRHYDLVIHCNQREDTLDLMKRLDADKQVFYWCDCRRGRDYDWKTIVSWKERLDALFISNRKQLGLFKKKLGVPTYFLPQAAYIPDRPVEFRGYQRNVVFMGNKSDEGIHKKRTKFIDRIRAPYETINSNDEEARRDNWRMMEDIYRHSKLVLDISAFWDIDGYVSGRFFFACGYNAASVSKRFPGYEELGYVDGKHKIFYDTPEEADEKMLYYLQNDNARERVREQGLAHTEKHHTYEHRMRTLLKNI